MTYLTIPESRYYVLGDDAEHSLDSRYWEDLFVKRIVVKLFFYCAS
ncbi:MULTISPECIES: S26 family signal peptidase [Bacillota]|nr:S26 family signal peptidase [[Clostridium] scindens]